MDSIDLTDDAPERGHIIPDVFGEPVAPSHTEYTLGFRAGQRNAKHLFVERVLKDQFIIANADVNVLDRIIQIIEGIK